MGLGNPLDDGQAHCPAGWCLEHDRSVQISAHAQWYQSATNSAAMEPRAHPTNGVMASITPKIIPVLSASEMQGLRRAVPLPTAAANASVDMANAVRLGSALEKSMVSPCLWAACAMALEPRMLTQPFRTESKAGYSPKRSLNSTTRLPSHRSRAREIPKELGRTQTPELNNRGCPNINGRSFLSSHRLRISKRTTR